MQACVKADREHDAVRACGTLFIKEEWRDVPISHEQDAITNPDLDCRVGKILIVAVEETP